ncbi:hypothetical protein LTR53_002768 [Teratosphaeriaceae sp. CCFEE 6253]|nr:hypothetical protein LTR53_002768 [Teratosphaeriaceae sp. CCFEE 6253]
MRYPFKISAKVRSKSGALDKRTPESLRLCYLTCKPTHKLPYLRSILQETKAEKTILYVSTRAGVDYLKDVLPALLSVSVFPVHGDYKAPIRAKNVQRFRDAVAPAVLLTTDVLARGIDIPDIDLVVQLDAPSQSKDFIHRCGRSGRAGKRGLAVTFLTPGAEEDYVKYLELQGTKLEAYPSGSPVLDEEAAAVVQQIRNTLLTKREFHDRSQRAFVSWVQAYIKTLPADIFDIKKADWAETGRAWGLLRWPKMPELKRLFPQAVADRTTGLDLPAELPDLNELCYADSARETKRQALLQALARGERPTTSKGGAAEDVRRRKERAWSSQKDAKAVREGRRERKERGWAEEPSSTSKQQSQPAHNTTRRRPQRTHDKPLGRPQAAAGECRTKAAPVGSASWIQCEREQAAHFIDQEAEELGFSVRNEMDWLNEHLSDVFSRNNVTFADICKTPGKLRGKTPRTTRRPWDAGPAPRQPLTDIFAAATTAQIAPSSIQHRNAVYDKVARFEIAEDHANMPEHRPASRGKSPQRVGKPGNTDSGYHGMTEDEMDVDSKTETATASSQDTEGQKVPLKEDQECLRSVRQGTVEAGRVSDESFMSAKEEMQSGNASRQQMREEVALQDEDVEMDDEEGEIEHAIEHVPANTDLEEDNAESEDEETVDDTPPTPSDGASSPEKPLQRKSSFTFSALPAREPLTAKRSIGYLDNQVDAGRNSVLARSFGAKSLSVPQDEAPTESQEKTEETKTHHKTTTQLLHERITMLGKTKEPRMSKSIVQSGLGAPATYPKLPPTEEAQQDTAATTAASIEEEVSAGADVGDEEDDWIAPSKPAPIAQGNAIAQAAPHSAVPQDSLKRPTMHQKSMSASHVPSPRPVMPTGHQKAQSVSHPNLANAAGMMSSTTPAGSPVHKKHHDGPLSASKNKLWSALKTAKNIFASSASASAAAKLEAYGSPGPKRSPQREVSDGLMTAAVYHVPGGTYSHTQLPLSPSKAGSIISASPSRKTRTSAESDKKREKEMKAQARAQQKAESELEKAREKERMKAMKQQEEKRKADEAEAKKEERLHAAEAAERPLSANSEESDLPPLPPPKSMLPAGKLRAPGRLLKPTRAEPHGRPAPVAIRVASQSQRLGQAGPAASLSKSQHESMAPPPPPKTGLRTASAQGSVRGSTAVAGNSRGVKALEAAAKKREADEKVAAKKAEQKRELERKRAAKADEERKVEEERKAAEQTRLQEARLAAQRKADAEVKRRELVKVQQEEAERAKARAAHDLADAIKRERAAAQAQPAAPRGDVAGTLRQLAKNTVPAAAKPAKRVFQTEEEELQRPGLQRGPPSYQQNDAKRRRTNEGEDEVGRHSVMAPPKRPSNMRKESTVNKFPHGYTHAPPPAPHHAMPGGSSSIFKATVTAQHQLQHAQIKSGMPTHPSQTVQMSNARIPFAENANPPAAVLQHQAYHQQMYGGNENAQQHAAGNKFKTPARPAQALKSAKSSPLYPNGDAIQLPEIMTDSEDEDSEDENTGFRAPSWVASPALRDLLTQQQLVDPETVFGPIGELKMEEVFQGGKNGDRMKRFRDRGSSAAWVESGDAVTSAEKRRDMEARERVVRDGGWRFEPTA